MEPGTIYLRTDGSPQPSAGAVSQSRELLVRRTFRSAVGGGGGTSGGRSEANRSHCERLKISPLPLASRQPWNVAVSIFRLFVTTWGVRERAVLGPAVAMQMWLKKANRLRWSGQDDTMRSIIVADPRGHEACHSPRNRGPVPHLAKVDIRRCELAWDFDGRGHLKTKDSHPLPSTGRSPRQAA